MSVHDVPPWEPPFAGTEADHLIGALERLRATFRWKTADLDGPGLDHRIGSSALSLGGLLRHLTLVEHEVFTRRLSGTPLDPTWDSVDDGTQWAFATTDEDPAVTYDRWDRAVVLSRVRLDAALAAGGLGQPIALTDPSGNPASLRRLLCDLIEEYGRHTGHADLLREAVDGRVGEDPPPDFVWPITPRSGDHDPTV